MKILLISPMLPHVDGAGAIPMLLHAELVGLRERHDVTLVAGIGDEPEEEDAARSLIGEGVDIHLADRRRPSPGPRRVERQLRLATTWARGRWPWRTVWFAAPSAQTVIDRLSVTRAFDIVAVEDCSMSVFRLPQRVPAVLTEHEVRRPGELRRRPGPPSAWPGWVARELDRRRWAQFQPAAWRRFDRLQVFTHREAGAVAELAPDLAPRVRVNPFGLVLPAAADPAREQPGMVLFVGNFTHPPNRDAALWLARQIMPAVRVRHANARLRIVGAAPPREVLALAGPRVEVVANASAVQPHLEAASVVLAPVRTGGGMRMKVLQALATGKPVVTTTRGTDGYGGHGRVPPLVVADDVEGIAAATAQLLKDERRRRELGAHGRRFALDHHSPTAWATRLEAVYEEARDGRREAASRCRGLLAATVRDGDMHPSRPQR